MSIVTEKERVVEAIHQIPEDETIEEAMERLMLLAKIDRGIREADARDTIPHSDMKRRMGRWQT